jgi:hypothetical protein
MRPNNGGPAAYIHHNMIFTGSLRAGTMDEWVTGEINKYSKLPRNRDIEYSRCGYNVRVNGSQTRSDKGLTMVEWLAYHMGLTGTIEANKHSAR